MKKPLLILLLFISACGCLTSDRLEEDSMSGKTVSFQTTDNVTIVGTLWEANTSKPPVILVHQLGKDRHTYDSFAKKIVNEGYTVLSIDLRGHGDSTKRGGGTISYTLFTENDWKQIVNDINAAYAFLATDSPFIVGASIGANAALQYASDHPSTRGIILLSPGINYHGVDVTIASKKNTVSTLIIASKEDSYSANSSQLIFSSLAISDKKLLLVENAGHGTDMLIQKPELANEILMWFNEHA